MNEPTLTIEGASELGTIVLANSLAASHAMWRQQVAAWRAAHRIVRFDYAGHGGTSDSGAPASIAGIASALLAALDAAGIQRFAFVGLSLGGLVGAAAGGGGARARRASRDCQFALDAGPTPRARRGPSACAAVRDARHACDRRRRRCERWFTAEFRARAPQAVADVRAMILRTSADGYAAAARRCAIPMLRPWLAQIRCPALVVSGDRDAAAPPEHLQELAQALERAPPAARAVRAPVEHRAGHDAFTAEVGTFLLNPRTPA